MQLILTTNGKASFAIFTYEDYFHMFVTGFDAGNQGNYTKIISDSDTREHVVAYRIDG